MGKDNPRLYQKLPDLGVSIKQGKVRGVLVILFEEVPLAESFKHICERFQNLYLSSIQFRIGILAHNWINVIDDYVDEISANSALFKGLSSIEIQLGKCCRSTKYFDDAIIDGMHGMDLVLVKSRSRKSETKSNKEKGKLKLKFFTADESINIIQSAKENLTDNFKTCDVDRRAESLMRSLSLSAPNLLIELRKSSPITGGWIEKESMKLRKYFPGKCEKIMKNFLYNLEFDPLPEGFFPGLIEEDTITAALQLLFYKKDFETTEEEYQEILRSLGPEVYEALGAEKDRSFWNVVEPISNFAGRKEELNALNLFLNSPKPLLVISGMGGQGKTELCRKWVSGLRSRQENRFGIVWLAGDNKATFLSSLLQFGKSIKLELDEGLEQIPDILMKMESKLGKNTIWILDNVHTLSKEVDSFCRAIFVFRPKHKIVITTRLLNLFQESVEYLFLSNLQSEDGFQLVKECIQDAQAEEIENLLNELGGHALALQLAVHFITQNRITLKGKAYSITDFLETFSKNKTAVLNEPGMLWNYGKTVIQSVQESLEVISKKNGKSLPSVVILLSLVRQDGIELGFLSRLNPDSMGRKEVESWMEDLKSLSLIECENSFISIHPLVQDCIRLLHPEEWRSLALRLFQDGNNSNYFSPLTAFPHYLRVWEIVCQEESLQEEFVAFMKNLCRKLDNSGSFLSTISNFSKTWKDNLCIIYNCSEEECKDEDVISLKPSSQTTEELKQILSNVAEELGNLRHRFGANSEIRTWLEAESTMAFLVMGCSEEAEKIYQESFLLVNRGCWTDTEIKLNLALEKSSVKNALQILSARCRGEKSFDHNQSHMPWILFNIGICHLRQKNYSEAAKHFDSVLNTCLIEVGFGKEVKQWLALALIKLERYKEASEIIEGGLKSQKFRDRRRAVNIFNYAYCLKNMGQIDAAEKAMEKVKLLVEAERKTEIKELKTFLNCLCKTIEYDGGKVS